MKQPRPLVEITEHAEQTAPLSEPSVRSVRGTVYAVWIAFSRSRASASTSTPRFASASESVVGPWPLAERLRYARSRRTAARESLPVRAPCAAPNLRGQSVHENLRLSCGTSEWSFAGLPTCSEPCLGGTAYSCSGVHLGSRRVTDPKGNPPAVSTRGSVSTLCRTRHS